MKVTSIVQTSTACPSQWEGTLEDGRMVYVRYRWGYLSVRVSPTPTTEVLDAVDGEEVFGKEIGGGLDGWLSYSQLKEEVPADVIEFP